MVFDGWLTYGGNFPPPARIARSCEPLDVVLARARFGMQNSLCSALTPIEIENLVCEPLDLVLGSLHSRRQQEVVHD
jgi:hypothetical protein